MYITIFQATQVVTFSATGEMHHYCQFWSWSFKAQGSLNYLYLGFVLHLCFLDCQKHFGLPKTFRILQNASFDFWPLLATPSVADRYLLSAIGLRRGTCSVCFYLHVSAISPHLPLLFLWLPNPFLAFPSCSSEYLCGYTFSITCIKNSNYALYKARPCKSCKPFKSCFNQELQMNDNNNDLSLALYSPHAI